MPDFCYLLCHKIKHFAMRERIPEILFNLVYNRKSKLNKEGKALIQIRAYQNAKSIYFSTGIYVKPFNWNKKRSKVIKHRLASTYNKQINGELEDLEDFQVQTILHKGHCCLLYTSPSPRD